LLLLLFLLFLLLLLLLLLLLSICDSHTWTHDAIIMSDTLSGAVVPSQRPRSAQDASLTGRIAIVPVESGAVGGTDARPLTVSERRGVALSTALHVRVVVRNPRHARFYNSACASQSQIPLRYLVADRSEAGRRPAASRNLAYHLARASRSATSFEPVCDQIA